MSNFHQSDRPAGRPPAGPFTRLVAHLLVRVLVLTPMPAEFQVWAVMFPLSILAPLVTADTDDADQEEGARCGAGVAQALPQTPSQALAVGGGSGNGTRSRRERAWAGALGVSPAALSRDKLGRETARILPDGEREEKTYWPTGSLKTRTDFMGRITNYAYDVNERLQTRTYPVGTLPTVSFTYTPTGRRDTVTIAGLTTDYDYDDRDRLETLTYPDGRTLEYLNDANGNRTSLKATIGTTVLTTAFTYDDASRLDLVTDPVGRVHDHGYDLNGNRESLSQPNGTVTGYVYDDLNRLKTLTTTHPASSVTIQSYALTLGPSGNRTRITEGDGSVRDYTYDDLYRLTGDKVTISGLLQYEKVFTYDKVGNRQTQATTGAGTAGTPTAPGSLTYAYDERDRLEAETGTLAGQPVGITYGYDDNGNLLTKSGEATYTWDLENRLVRVTKTDGTVVDHVYDADGVRLKTTTTPSGQPAQVTNYLVDTSGSLSHVVAETDTAGALKAYYVRGDDLLAVMRPLVPAPASAADWQTRYVHADGIGSIRRLTDENGAITDGYTYTAFGELLAHTGTDPQPYAFAGEPSDPNVGFQYHRARWMDPRLARFVSMDPLLARADSSALLQAYSYGGSNPVNTVDPTGLFFESGSALAALSAGVSIWGMASLNMQALAPPPVLNIQPIELADDGRARIPRVGFPGWSRAREMNGQGVDFQLGAAATLWGRYGVSLNILPKKGPIMAWDATINVTPLSLFAGVAMGGLRSWPLNTLPVVFCLSTGDIGGHTDAYTLQGSDIQNAIALGLRAADREKALAHEIGHTLDLPDGAPAGNLMDNTGDGTSLGRDQIDIALKGARRRARGR